MPELDRTFFALSDATRRAILARLQLGSATISDLAAQAGMTLTGLKKHVQILEEAELVITEKIGRERHCRLAPQGMDPVARWLENYQRGWQDRHDRLEAIIERRKESSS